MKSKFWIPAVVIPFALAACGEKATTDEVGAPEAPAAEETVAAEEPAEEIVEAPVNEVEEAPVEVEAPPAIEAPPADEAPGEEAAEVAEEEATIE
ncbi:MAG: hypothetical protein ACNA8L_02925 [Luteolibacter sp.]|jgi:hypothetical protein